MNNRRCLRLCFTWMLGLSMLAGCHLRDGEKDWLGRKEDPESHEGKTPQKLVAIWSNSVINQDGQTATRGLGGRIYFYDEQHKPIKVDGRLVVYVYDDSSPTGLQRKDATRKFEFTKEQLASQLSYSQIGPSYNVWLPWDAVGGTKAKLSVIPVFTDPAGQLVVGEQARHILPGREPTQLATGDESRPRMDGSISTAGYNETRGMNPNVAQTSAERQIRKPSITSSWIPLPRSVQRRLSMPLPKTQRKQSLTPTTAMSTGERRKSESEAVTETTTSVAYPSPPTRLSPPRRPVRTSLFARQGRDLELKQPGLATPPSARAE